MRENYTQASFQDALYQETNINIPEFFESFLQQPSYVSFGSHSYSYNGNAFLVGRVEKALADLVNRYKDSERRLYTIESSTYLINYPKIKF